MVDSSGKPSERQVIEANFTPPTCASVCIVVVGMYVCFILQGIIQQLLYETDISGQKFVFTGSLLFFTTLISSFIAVLYKLFCDHINQRKYNMKAQRKTSEIIAIHKPMDIEDTSLCDAKLVEDHDSQISTTPNHFVYQLIMSPFTFFGIANGPVKDVFLCSSTFIVAKYLGWHALTLVDFPTQSLGKCAKPVAILVLSIFIPSRKYKTRDVVSALWITASLFVFNMAKIRSNSGEVSSTIYGNILLLVSLLCEGLTGTRQDKLAVIHDLSNVQLMFAMNFASSLLLFPLCAVYEFPEFFKSLITTPLLSAFVFMFCAACAIGQLFMYASIKIIGAMHTSIVTTTKKLMMVLISVYILRYTSDSKKQGFAPLQWVCVFSVAASVLIHAYISKKAPSKGTMANEDRLSETDCKTVMPDDMPIHDRQVCIHVTEEGMNVEMSLECASDIQKWRRLQSSPCTGSTITPISSGHSLA